MKKVRFLLILFGLLPCFLLAQTASLVIPIGHTEYVSASCMSPDGNWVLTSSYDNGTKLWDAKGREIFTLPVSSYVNAFAPDSKSFLTADTANNAILWSLSGQIIQKFGHTDQILYVAFSPDGNSVLTNTWNREAILWSLDGKIEFKFEEISNAYFSADGQFVLSARGYTVSAWDLKGNKVLQFEDPGLKQSQQNSNPNIPSDSYLTSVAVSPDKKYFATGAYSDEGGIWSWEGEKISSISGADVQFSPDGKYVLTTANRSNYATLWDLKGNKVVDFPSQSIIISARFTPNAKSVLLSAGIKVIQMDLEGKIIQEYKGLAANTRSLSLSADNTFLAVGCCDEWGARLWRFKDGFTFPFNGDGKKLYFGNCYGPIPIAISPDSKTILTTRGDNEAVLLNLDGIATQSFADQEESIEALAFSPDGQQILTGNRLYRAREWNLNGREERSFIMPQKNSSVESVAYSPDGAFVLTGSGNLDNKVRLWDRKGKLLKEFVTEDNQIKEVVFSPDSRFVLAGGYRNAAQMWDLNGNQNAMFIGHKGSIYSVSFSPDGQFVLTGSEDGTAKLWDLTGKEIRSFSGHKSAVIAAAFFSNGKFILTGSLDHTAKIWEASSGKELATLVFIGTKDWVVTTPSGLFDATDGAKALMYYIVDYQEEKIVVSLDQLQERYWQPGLLGAVLGLTNYPIRDVGDFENLPLFPSIEDSTRVEGDLLRIQLRERNGGIGKLSLKINGRRVAEDLNPLPNRKKTLKIDLREYSRYLRTDTLNTLELEAYESQDYLKSEPYILEYQASVRKRGDGESGKERLSNNCLGPRHLYLIMVGTSLYPQGVDSLPSANEDAIEMARVLSATGKQLYDERVHLTLLSTKSGKTPSKANIAAAFKAYQDSASVCDVLVVFFAGHGSNWGKDGDKSNFYYLTKDISFGNLSDDGVRKAYAISDQELTEWMTKIPAQNQLLILDACNSGQAAINMGGIVSRDLDPDQVIAFNLMSGNTGSYVISGSSESGASFESAVFGHGLLTYSLLEGINGTALEGSKVDVLPLLLKSYKRVGELAKSLGQEQTPIVAKPRGNASFFVGRNDGSIKIDLPESKPMVIRSFLFEKDALNDKFGLTKAVNTAFRNMEVRGKQAPWFFLDIMEHPQGFTVRGNYTFNKDNTVTVKGRLLKGEDWVGDPFEVSGEKDVKVLANLILKVVRPGIKVK